MHAPPDLLLGAGLLCAFLAFVLPSRSSGGPVIRTGGGWGGAIVAIALGVAAVAAILGSKPVPAAAVKAGPSLAPKPSPSVITHIVTKVVQVNAHPVLSGGDWLGIIIAVCITVLGGLSIYVNRRRG